MPAIGPVGIQTDFPTLGGFRFQVGISNKEILVIAVALGKRRYLEACTHRSTDPEP